MDFKKENRHMVDVLFVVALFCIFAFCALMLVILGADIYKKTVADMDQNYISRTGYAYVSEKIRQCDAKAPVSVEQFGDGDAIMIRQDIAGRDYYTCLYVDEGYLKELFTADPQAIGPKGGQKIIACDYLACDLSEDGKLLHTTIRTEDGTEEIVSAIRSEGGLDE